MIPISKKSNNSVKSKTETNEICSFYGFYNLSNTIRYNLCNNYSLEELRQYISDPQTHNEIIRNISQVLYSANGIYRNTADYMTSMPTLNYVITSEGEDQEIIKKKKKESCNILKKIKHRNVIRDCLHTDIVEGIVFKYFEITKTVIKTEKSLSDYQVDTICEINEENKFKYNYSVICLPTDYCKIISRKNSSPVVAFNLKYFESSKGKDLKLKLKGMPKEIRQAYEQYNNGKINNWYVLDNTRTICHKISSSDKEVWGRPLVLPAIIDILYSDYVTDTKRNTLDNVNSKLVYQTFPESDKKGQTPLSEQQQKDLHNNTYTAIKNRNTVNGISMASIPPGTKLDVLDLACTDILNKDYEGDLSETISTSLGFAASLLNASGTTSFSSQHTNLELVSSQVFQWIDEICDELNKVLNYHLNELFSNNKTSINVNYLPITHINKDKMISNAKDLYMNGKGSLTLWAACCGFNSEVFYSLLDEELEQDIENKYPVHKTSYNTSGSEDSNEGGRPKIDDITNKSTENTRNNNGNYMPKPSNQ